MTSPTPPPQEVLFSQDRFAAEVAYAFARRYKCYIVLLAAIFKHILRALRKDEELRQKISDPAPGPRVIKKLNIPARLPTLDVASSVDLHLWKCPPSTSLDKHASRALATTMVPG